MQSDHDIIHREEVLLAIHQHKGMVRLGHTKKIEDLIVVRFCASDKT